MRLDQAARSIFLEEFVQAFFLSMRYFFKPKATLNHPFEKARCHRASAASMYCAAIPTARSAASPASSARRSVRRRPSPSRPAREGTTAPAATTRSTSIWSNASIAGYARKLARSTPSSRARISNSPPKIAGALLRQGAPVGERRSLGARVAKNSRSTRRTAESSARDEFLVAATAQNLRKLAKLIPTPSAEPAWRRRACAFGYAQAHEDDAERAVRAGLELSKRWRAEVQCSLSNPCRHSNRP